MATFNPAQVAVQPIASLTPFMGGKFWIKARAIDKGDVRTWNKPNSTGKLFSVTLVDETSAIRATFFNEQVDQFHNVIENGKVFYVGGGSIKGANRRFNNVNNEYELTAGNDTQIHLARDAATSIPTQRYNFVPIQTLAHKEDGSPIDVLGVVTKVAPTTKIVSKAGAELTKRDVTLADSTAAVDVTFWNDQAVAFDCDVGAVIAMKNVRVKHFNGVTISTNQGTSIDVSPAIPDTATLQRWYQSTGGASKSLSGQGREGGESLSLGRRYFRQIDTEGLGRGEKPDYVTVRCVPTFIKTDSLWYDACPTCNKKVVTHHDASRCEKCNADVKSTARYMCSMQFSDGVSSKWATMFNEGGEVFWGCSADDLKQEALANPTAIQKRAQQRLYRPLLVNLRVKEERGQVMADGTPLEDRVRCNVTRVEDFLYPAQGKHTTASECEQLVESIRAFHV
mmetsp:Transcript_37330/g.115290  ORF Transcript_37330/g.115290 Transcript_37330/m.115290 type:complete len:452 (-) Transcript_37330:267-1622(-)|eukprot:CAMPEP_0174829490 /NCGR_PEP_ID=MMETSP1114-20130205/1954_1 /TAXON_ID=312471 /ORGANISM="Neobodo designis, Strain CCAP 1951/1" /LENGTH=451 /DNA_ID=CAMNT_0016063239 /DNA_START=52 /DNA_END=1407 /DNA_ORIENTATION=+